MLTLVSSLIQIKEAYLFRRVKLQNILLPKYRNHDVLIMEMEINNLLDVTRDGESAIRNHDSMRIVQKQRPVGRINTAFNMLGSRNCTTPRAATPDSTRLHAVGIHSYTELWLGRKAI